MEDTILEIGFGGGGLDLGRVTNEKLTWGELMGRLSTPKIDDIDMSDYLALDKDARDRRKSVGFLTGGPCVDGIRDASHMHQRQLVMLDCDDLSNRDIYECAKIGALPGLDVEAFVHSTRKSTEETPRLRMIFPLARSVDPVEFVAVARILAAKLDATMTSFDTASFSMSQIMFLPSVCRDVPYFAQHIAGSSIADPDTILAEFPDWSDMSTLPKKTDEKIRLRDPNDRAMDPREKRGVIGAFCRRIDIHAAILEYLPDVYVRSSKRGMTDRYTRIGSEGANGAISYDDLYLYSHHGTDPAHGKLLNSFDLVRIHLFAQLDIGYEGAFRTSPSQQAMISLAMEDDRIKAEVEAERALPRVSAADFDDEADAEETIALPGAASSSAPIPSGLADFEDLMTKTTPAAGPVSSMDLIRGIGANPDAVVIPEDDEMGISLPPTESGLDQETCPNGEVLKLLKRSRQGLISATAHNLGIILQHDPRFAGKLCWSEMLQDPVFVADIDPMMPYVPVLPLRDHKQGDRFGARHAALLRAVLDAPIASGGYGVSFQKSDFDSAISNTSHFHPVHPIRDKLASFVHDGTQRIDTLFIDYLGASDDAYHRTVSRLFCLGAVARVFEPGCKFDFLPVVEGRQGLRKSTFVRTLSMGWATELQSGDLGKPEKLVEKLCGAWIAEVPELSAVSNTSIESMKALITATDDKTRLAYKEYAEIYPRQSVFFGTVDHSEYLKDENGNRRFWPVKATVASIDIERLRGEVEQIWAEAVVEYRKLRESCGDDPLPLYIADNEVETVARNLQGSRREFGIEEELAGQIELGLMTPQDVDPELVRTGFWEEVVQEDGRRGMVMRLFCLRQIWTDILKRDDAAYDGKTPQILGSALRSISFVSAENCQRTFPGLGRQRAFRSNYLT